MLQARRSRDRRAFFIISSGKNPVSSKIIPTDRILRRENWQKLLKSPDFAAFSHLARLLQCLGHGRHETVQQFREGTSIMKNIVFVAAITAATIATPALARVAGSFGGAKMTLNEKTGKYCLKQTVSGSLIHRVICRTVDEWADAGLTITRKPATQLAQR